MATLLIIKESDTIKLEARGYHNVTRHELSKAIAAALRGRPNLAHENYRLFAVRLANRLFSKGNWELTGPRPSRANQIETTVTLEGKEDLTVVIDFQAVGDSYSGGIFGFAFKRAPKRPRPERKRLVRRVVNSHHGFGRTQKRILAAIAEPHTFIERTRSDTERNLIESGMMPHSVLSRILGLQRRHLDTIIERAIRDGQIKQVAHGGYARGYKRNSSGE